MSAKKTSSKAKPAIQKEGREISLKVPSAGNRAPVMRFDRFCVSVSETEVLVRTMLSIDPSASFSFTMSRCELASIELNLGPYLEAILPHVDQELANRAIVKSHVPSPYDRPPLYPSHVRYIRFGRMAKEGELLLYCFSSTDQISSDGKDDKSINAKAIAVLNADLNAHYRLALELFDISDRGAVDSGA